MKDSAEVYKLLIQYLANEDLRLGNALIDYETASKRRDATTADFLRLAIASARLDSFREFQRDIVRLLGLDEYEDFS